MWRWRLVVSHPAWLGCFVLIHVVHESTPIGKKESNNNEESNKEHQEFPRFRRWPNSSWICCDAGSDRDCLFNSNSGCWNKRQCEVRSCSWCIDLIEVDWITTLLWVNRSVELFGWAFYCVSDSPEIRFFKYFQRIVSLHDLVFSFYFSRREHNVSLLHWCPGGSGFGADHADHSGHCMVYFVSNMWPLLVILESMPAICMAIHKSSSGLFEIGKNYKIFPAHLCLWPKLNNKSSIVE